MTQPSTDDEHKIAGTGGVALAVGSVLVLAPIANTAWLLAHIPEAAPTLLLFAALQAIPGVLLCFAASSLRRCGQAEGELLTGLRRLRIYFVVEALIVVGLTVAAGLVYAIASLLAT